MLLQISCKKRLSARTTYSVKRSIFPFRRPKPSSCCVQSRLSRSLWLPTPGIPIVGIAVLRIPFLSYFDDLTFSIAIPILHLLLQHSLSGNNLIVRCSPRLQALCCRFSFIVSALYRNSNLYRILS